MTERPQRPPVAELPAFDNLDKTHAEILQQLEVFGDLLSRLEREGLDSQARQMAKGICDFFEGDARQHHADEERLVFPGLLKTGDERLVHEIRRLQQDHGWLEEDWRAILPHLKSVADGYAGYDMEMLRHALPVFSQLYREHIALEESLIYPAARHQQETLQSAAQERRDSQLGEL